MTTVVTSGLVLDVDTKNSASWPGTGTLLTNTVSGSTVNLILDDTIVPGSITTDSDSVTMIYNPTGNSQSLKTTGSLSMGSVMFWMYRTEQNTDEYLIDCRNDISLSWYILGGGNSPGTYWSTGTHYINGVVATNLSSIPIGEWASVAITASSSTIESGIARLLNGNGKNFSATIGRILIYDRQITEAEVIQNHEELIPDLTVSDGTGDVSVTIKEITGAIGYQLRHTISGGSEVIEVSDITDLTYTITGLVSASDYTISLYVDTGSGYSFVNSEDITTAPPLSESLVAWYLLNNPATFLEDNSGNGHTLTDVNGVESFNDSEFGTVAYFSNSPTKYLSLAVAPDSTLGASPRTYSYWVKQVGNDSFRIMFGQSTSPELRVQFSNSRFDINGGSGSNTTTTFAPNDTWVYIALTYDGTTERTYFDGALSKTSVRTYSTGAGALFIGSAPSFASNFSINGYMTDFRIYDKALSDAEVSTVFTTGPTINNSLLTLTESSVYIRVASPEDLVNPYRRIDITDPESNTTTVVTGSTDLEYIIPNLIPETEYTIGFYNSTDDSTYTLVETAVITTLENTEVNFDASEFLDNTIYDFTSFSSDSFLFIDPLLDGILTTGDIISINDTNGDTYETSFVDTVTTDTVDFDDSKGFLLPFHTTGQTVTISSEVITYNANGGVTVGGIEYLPGSSFRFNGKTVFVLSS